MTIPFSAIHVRRACRAIGLLLALALAAFLNVAIVVGLFTTIRWVIERAS